MMYMVCILELFKQTIYYKANIQSPFILSVFLSDDSKAGDKQTPISNVSVPSPTITEKLREISNSLRAMSSKTLSVRTPLDPSCKRQVTLDSMEPKTPGGPAYLRLEGLRYDDMDTPQSILKARSTGLKVKLKML